MDHPAGDEADLRVAVVERIAAQGRVAAGEFDAEDLEALLAFLLYAVGTGVGLLLGH